MVGSQRGWGGSCPGRLIETILQTRIANPVVVVDEVEKAGTPTSTNGHTFGLAQSLLPLLEPMTAQRWSCPYFQVKFDMTWVIWSLDSLRAQIALAYRAVPFFCVAAARIAVHGRPSLAASPAPISAIPAK